MSKLEFFIRCDAGARDYFEVLIHPNRTELLRAYARVAKKPFRDLTDIELEMRAVFEQHRPPRAPHRLLGRLHFSARDLSPGVVAHEIGIHAALAWAKLHRVNPVRSTYRRSSCLTHAKYREDPQERVAAVAQQLVDDFYSEYRALQERAKQAA